MQRDNILCVKEYLKSQHMGVVDEWLEGCVDFFQEKRQGHSYSNQELTAMVRGQWLLGDLNETCPGCLPNNLSSFVKTTLPGVYVLQLNFVLDIGVSAYQQFQKLSKVDTTNIEVTTDNNQSQLTEPSSNRVLKLSLTDGVQVISGLEYKPMRNLTIDLMPGTKLQIKGPVDCRRGVLMLEEKHVTVLGGEVEDLIRQNQYKNILTNIIKRNMDRNSDGHTTQANQFTREPTVAVARQQNQVQKQNNIRQRPTNNMARNQTIDAEVRELGNLDIEMFEDDFDVETIDKIEQSALNRASNQLTPKPVVKKMKMQRPERNESTAVQTKFEEFNENDFVDPPTNEEEYFLKMVEMEDIPDDVLKDDIKISYPIAVNDKPFVYIKQLMDLSNSELLNKKFVVKAQVISIINKLKFKNNDWDLKCKICDGSSYLDVDVSGHVLSSLVGYTSSEMSRMKSQMAADPQLKQQVVQGLTEAHRKLQTIDTLLEILYKPSGPCIMRIEEYTDRHLASLKERAFNIPK